MKNKKTIWTEAFLKDLGFSKRGSDLQSEDWILENKSKSFELMKFKGYCCIWMKSKKNEKQSLILKFYDKEKLKDFLSINNN
jgi:hypothetical protein